MLPVLPASTVLLTAKLSPASQAVWRVKTSQEMCGKRVSRSLDLAGSRSSCAGRKESRRKMKSLVRRRKKQLFGKKRRKKKSKRNKRGFFSPLVEWMLSPGEKRSLKIKEENAKDKKEKFKVNTLLEIASKKVKDTPSDFFQVVTASGMELSEFSGHQLLKTKNNTIPKEVTTSEPERRRRRNYKRRKSLFSSRPSTPWAGRVKSAGGHNSCPAYLLAGGGHALADSACVMTEDMPPTLTVIFSVYRVGVTRVTLHPSLHLALLSLHPQVPGRVEALCHPEDIVGRLVGSRGTLPDSHQLGDWLDQAVGGGGGS